MAENKNENNVSVKSTQTENSTSVNNSSKPFLNASDNNVAKGFVAQESNGKTHGALPSGYKTTHSDLGENWNTFTLPDWGIKNYIYERTSWLKKFDSFTGEPGWFYFKIFFNFDTSNGLLGGIMKDTKENNTAIDYLMSNLGRFNFSRDTILNNNTYTMCYHRMVALGKFVSLLSFINCKAPWFFKGVQGLDKAYSFDLDKYFTEKHELTIECMEEAVDMRLTTLFDLYKFACFDSISMKEVIPENLRKFDMSIMLFHTPLKWYQTGLMTQYGTFEYKSANDMMHSNRMSFKLFTFKNCEFDLDSLGTIMPSVNNESAFNLGKSSFKIKYDRVYQHNMNEWMDIMFGDNGFEYSASMPNMQIDLKMIDSHNDKVFSTIQTNMQSARMYAMSNAIDAAGYYNKDATLYKSMVDASELLITDNMRKFDGKSVFGNIYGSFDVGSTYFRKKLYKIKGQQRKRTKRGINQLIDWYSDITERDNPDLTPSEDMYMSKQNYKKDLSKKSIIGHFDEKEALSSTSKRNYKSYLSKPNIIESYY